MSRVSSSVSWKREELLLISQKHIWAYKYTTNKRTSAEADALRKEEGGIL